MISVEKTCKLCTTLENHFCLVIKKPWMKREGNLFDVTIGVYSGAEVCELLRICVLNNISENYDKNNIGLYGDDGLAVFQIISGPERKKKELSIII